MPVDLVLRVQEVDVAGGAHRLTKRLAQPTTARSKSRSSSSLCTMPFRSMKVLLQRGWISRKSYQEAMRLSSAQSLSAVTAWNSSRLAGRTDDQSLPILVDDRLRHYGVALEMVQIGPEMSL